MNRFMKFACLPFREKLLYFQSIFYLIIFRIKLLYIPPKALFGMATKGADVPLVSQSPTIAPVRLAQIITQASRFVPYSTCLTMALTGSVLFARNCCTSIIHIGVFMDGNRKLNAHAWLSYNGKILLGRLPELNLYKELPIELNLPGDRL